LFFASDRGGKTGEVLFRLAPSCQLHGLELFLLEDVL
jgi:hypothetical protein